MIVDGDFITLNRIECKDLIEGECQKLGMTAVDFVQKQRRGELADDCGVSEIKMLLKLLYN